MKAVLLSVNPPPCEQMASRKKKVEVRKTKPKLPVPFKAYIYCTKGKPPYLQSRNNMFFYLEDKDTIGGHGPGLYQRLNGTVIGEFVCEKIYYRNCNIHDFDTITLEELSELSCVSEDNLLKYADGGSLYGLEISNLKIYEQPKELSEFRLYNTRAYYDEELRLPMPTHEISRPPQSWCYVEELQG